MCYSDKVRFPNLNLALARKGEGCKNSESDSYLFPCQGNSQEEVQLAAEIFSFRPAGGIFILLTLSLTSTLFKTHTIFFFICHNEF